MNARLIEIIVALDLKITPAEEWAILGPDAAGLRATLFPAAVQAADRPALTGLLLAEHLSAHPNPRPWLERTIRPLQEGAAVVIIEWQADSRLDIGPPLERRLERGRLHRWLREAGFEIGKTVTQNLYYGLRATKKLTASSPQPAEFIEVATLETLPKNEMKPVALSGQNIIVANTGREIVAFARACPHAEGDLSQGRLRGRSIMCPVHFYIWNVATGQPTQPADEDILPRYPVKIEPTTGRIFVALEPGAG